MSQGLCSHWKTVLLWSVALSVVLLGARVRAAVLESPAPGATVSGIGFISGWKCDAGQITVRIDSGELIRVAMDQPRADTQPICGTVNNGFIVQINWNFLGDSGGLRRGHRIEAYDDGVLFAAQTFLVGSTGEEWLEVGGQYFDVPDFPAPGERAQFIWNESTQHLELVYVTDVPAAPSCDPDPEPEPDPEPSLTGQWILWSRLTANCQPATEGEGELYVDTTGGLSGWFQQDEFIRYAPGTFRTNLRYEIKGYVTQAGVAEWDVLYRRSDNTTKYMGTFEGTFRDENYGSGTWSYPVGCEGIWRATRP